MLPIYYVISEEQFFQQAYIVSYIIKVVECDMSDIDAVYRQEVAPLQLNSGRRISVMMFYRTPGASFFKETEHETAIQEPIQQYKPEPKKEIFIEPEPIQEEEPEVPYHEKVWDW